MSKRKWQRGDLITSLDELNKQELIWYDFGGGRGKVYHAGWWKSWQFHTLCIHLEGRRLYTVKPTEPEEELPW